MIVTQPDRLLLQREIAAFAPKLGGDILDVGGADGKRYRDLFHFRTYRTLDVVGSPDIRASADAIPLPDGSVDSILCAQMLQAVLNPQDHLREMHRVLKQGGKMILTVPGVQPVPLGDCFTFSLRSITRLCEQAGLRVVAYRQRGQYPSMIAQLRIRHWIETWKPYQGRSMWLLGPVSWAYTRMALSLDRFHHSQMFAIGWTFLLDHQAP